LAGRLAQFGCDRLGRVRTPAAAMVTAAPACDRARTVSIPMPLHLPVTIIVLPVRSTPSQNLGGVVENPNLVLNAGHSHVSFLCVEKG